MLNSTKLWLTDTLWIFKDIFYEMSTNLLRLLRLSTPWIPHLSPQSLAVPHQRTSCGIFWSSSLKLTMCTLHTITQKTEPGHKSDSGSPQWFRKQGTAQCCTLRTNTDSLLLAPPHWQSGLLPVESFWLGSKLHLQGEQNNDYYNFQKQLHCTPFRHTLGNELISARHQTLSPWLFSHQICQNKNS